MAPSELIIIAASGVEDLAFRQVVSLSPGASQVSHIFGILVFWGVTNVGALISIQFVHAAVPDLNEGRVDFIPVDNTIRLPVVVVAGVLFLGF